MREKYAFSERRACHLMMLAVTTYRYRSQRTDEPLRTKLVELAREKPRFGYRRLHVLLRRSGERVNHKTALRPASSCFSAPIISASVCLLLDICFEQCLFHYMPFHFSYVRLLSRESTRDASRPDLAVP